jgi:hypothetical protein
VGIRCADHRAPIYSQKLALISPTVGGRFVGTVLRTRSDGVWLFVSVCDCRNREKQYSCHVDSGAAKRNATNLTTFRLTASIEGTLNESIYKYNTYYRMYVIISDGVWIGNLIYWTRNYKYVRRCCQFPRSTDRYSACWLSYNTEPLVAIP